MVDRTSTESIEVSSITFDFGALDAAISNNSLLLKAYPYDSTPLEIGVVVQHSVALVHCGSSSIVRAKPKPTKSRR